MAPIIEPRLPLKDGYVEVEVLGERTYRNINTGLLIEEELRLAALEQPMSELTMTQMAITELAQVVEENNLANQLAIAELAEVLLGGES